MSPKSRGRKSKHKSKKARQHSSSAHLSPVHSGGDLTGDFAGDLTPTKLFAELLTGAHQLVRADHPLDAELLASDLVGLWWEADPGNSEIEEVLGWGLVEYAEEKGTTEALALLRVLADVGGSSLRRLAGEATARLASSGVRQPRWADQLGQVSAGDCWVLRDVYGDQESVLCAFDYSDQRHLLGVLIDHTLGGIAKDTFCTVEVDSVLAESREQAAQEPLAVFEPLPPQHARAILQNAFATTDLVPDAPVAEDFASNRAFALSRIRLLPEPEERTEPSGPDDETRAAIVAEFLSSPLAGDLADRDVTEACAHFIVDFGSDYDQGRPLRVSPVKTELFLLHWLPTHAVLSPAQAAAMPAVMLAWARWAAAQQGLPEEAVVGLVEVAEETGKEFPAAHDGPGDDSPIRGLLTEEELTDPATANVALRRRLFTLPHFGGQLGDEEFDRLDPTDEDQRRMLIEIEHPEYHEALADPAFSAEAAGVSPRLHITMHEIIANQLWDGEPPETWETARRLTRLGYDRHNVLHMLGSAAMEQVHATFSDRSPFDPEAYRAALDALPGDWPKD